MLVVTDDCSEVDSFKTDTISEKNMSMYSMIISQVFEIFKLIITTKT